MKVGTDGVLLGAWTPVRDADRRVLDVGTGTGLIALMLAQRTTAARITALDVDPDCVGQARENANASPWGHRIGTVCSPVQEFGDGPFDLIVSNPPFYDNSLPSPDAARTTARHTASLPSSICSMRSTVCWRRTDASPSSCRPRRRAGFGCWPLGRCGSRPGPTCGPRPTAA